MKPKQNKEKIIVEAKTTNKGLKDVYVRPPNAPYVHFRAISDSRVVYILTLLNEL